MEKNPFQHLQPWMNEILQMIRKDIKTDHLSVDRAFYKTHFGSKPLNKLSTEEIFSVYEKEILSGNETLVEWAVNRWVFKHGDLYRLFVAELTKINPNFTEIETLADAQAESVINAALPAFGAKTTYLFSRINGVVFSDAIFDRLHQAALKDTAETATKAAAQSKTESLEQIIERQQREISRLQEKYEDKLAGVMRKYTVDTEALKTQIRALQKSKL